MNKWVARIALIVAICEVIQGDWVVVVLCLVAIAWNRDKYTDSHRRGDWWK